MASYEQGYEDERFANAVSQNFHCPICMNVFNDPVMCQRNQHCFCRPCITRHLENSQTCPSCMEELSLDTLGRAPRIVLGCLSELNIRCDYFSRGCHQFVQLEKLESHVKDCGFAPVICSNGCLEKINKRDRAHHEAEVCELRKVKCHNCTEMTKLIEDIKMATKDELDKMQNGLTKVKDNLQKLEDSFTAVKDKFHEMVELKQRVDQLVTSDEIRGAKDEIMREIRKTQHGGTNEKPSIVVAGGFNRDYRELNSVEIFDWPKDSWLQLQPMTECRERAHSFVHKNKITVSGGWIDYQSKTNSMEEINIGQILDHSAQWRDSQAKLPGKFSAHKTVVYNERLIVISGLEEHGDFSGSIQEVLLYPPYTTRLLATMPQSRVYHGVELFDDKIFIVGGSKTGRCKDSVDSVLLYDINKNKFQHMTSLPISVRDMATVKWGDNIILLGGEDKDSSKLNTVIIYNVKTEKSHMLPDMKYRREGCAAVVSGNTLVVMGGRDENGNCIKSVECFTFDRYSWEELPSMSEERYGPTAVAF